MNIRKYYIVLLPFFILCCNTKSGENSNKTAEAQKTITDKAENPFVDTTTYLRVFVDQNEQITLNGNLISIEYLDLRLQNLKSKGGLVFYSCFGITEDTPNEGQVIDLIKKYQLGIKTFTDSTFTKSFF